MQATTFAIFGLGFTQLPNQLMKSRTLPTPPEAFSQKISSYAAVLSAA
jgi:hypothetical protein